MPNYLNYQIRRQIYLLRKAYILDVYNLFRFGFNAPKKAELLWINAKDCNYVLLSKNNNDLQGRRYSGQVLSSFSRYFVKSDVMNLPKIKFCYMHWVDGYSWEQTGVYDYMQKLIEKHGREDDCETLEDIKIRYKKLDEVFEQIKKEKKIKTRKELNNKDFRESLGIFIHIGKNGEPFLGCGGHHRFAIAKILNITFPAQIGFVHKSGIKYLKKYRKSPFLH